MLRDFIHQSVYIDHKILEYIVRLGRATRDPGSVGRADLRELLPLGISPRSYQHLLALSRVTAFLHGRTWALPEDVKEIFCDATRHRIARTVRAQAENVRRRRDPRRSCWDGGADPMSPAKPPTMIRRSGAALHRGGDRRARSATSASAPTRARCAARGSISTSTSRTGPGDDVRRIDWNVTARMGAPFVRHTHAEREMNVMVVDGRVAVDDARHDRALEARGADLHLGIDPVLGARRTRSTPGFVAFADRVLLSTQPKRTRAAAWNVLEQAWALKPSSSKTLMLPVVRHLTTTLKRMSLIFIVSDFVTD